MESEKQFNNLPKRGPGRPKGSPNKLHKAAKDAIAAAAAQLGGENRLAAWAKEDPVNERAFWTQVYPRLVQTESKASLTVSGGLVMIPAKSA